MLRTDFLKDTYNMELSNSHCVHFTTAVVSAALLIQLFFLHKEVAITPNNATIVLF
jgi:hypothetical protein